VLQDLAKEIMLKSRSDLDIEK